MHITSLSWSLCVLNFPRISLIYLIFFHFFSIALFSFVFKNSSKPNLGPLHRHTRHVSHRVSLRKPVCSHRGVHQNASTVLFSKNDVPWAVPPARPNPLSSLRHPRLKPALSGRRVSGIEIASYCLTRGCNIQPDAGMYIPRVVTLPPQELDHLFPERMNIHQCGRMSAAQPVATSGPTPCHLDYSNICLILVYSHLRRPSCFCQ